jgi:acyl-CoA reductase-like NAD-dependent aldehyde dehydrogenase
MIERLVKRMDAFGSEGGPRLSPIISAAQRQKIDKYVRGAIDEGACRRTAEPQGVSEFHVQPVLFTDVRPDSRLAREEIFGPVLAAFPFDQEPEAVALANASAYGLTTGVWTRDLNRALRLSKALDSGTVYVNRYFASGVELPLGGFKDSGIGHERGRLSLDEYTRVKGVSINISPLQDQES